MGLMGFGFFFLLFGVLLYFDSVLLAFGNVSNSNQVFLHRCFGTFIIKYKKIYSKFVERENGFL